MDHEWPFGIYDLIPIMGIKTKGFDPKSSTTYAKCPLCGDTKFRMKIFRESDSWVCFHCGETGGMLDLYAQIMLGRMVRNKDSRAEAYKDIMSRLGLFQNTPDYQNAVNAVKAVKRSEPPKQVIASVKERNKTYKTLLNLVELELTDEHYKELYSRGFSDEVIESNSYRSFSSDLEWANSPVAKDVYEKELKPLIQNDENLSKFTVPELYAGLMIGMALEGQGCTMKGVPGFFRIGKRWLFRVHSDSILIPLRNERGQIQSMQLRLQSSKLRYMSVSSSKFPEGCGPQEFYHFPLNAVGYGENNTLLLTEGPLKADAFSALCPNPMPVVCITGVIMARDLPTVFTNAKENGIDYVVNALDMDRLLNKQVRRAAKKIRKIAADAGLKMIDLCWDAPRAHQHCEIMMRLAQSNNIQLPDKLPANVYRRVEYLAALLDKSKIQHSIRWDADNTSVKRKGIDDVWLAYLRSS